MPSFRSPRLPAFLPAAGVAVVLGLGAALGLAASAAIGAPAPPPEPDGRTDLDRELETLGETLKAAALSGAISAEEAGEVWAVLAGRLVDKDSNGSAKAKSEDAGSPRAGSFATAMVPPSAEDLSPLFEPVIQRRDLRPLVERLDLDADQETIVAVSIEDAGETLDAAAAPLLEAVRRFRRATTDRWIQDVLARTLVAPDDRRLDRLQANLDAMGLGEKTADPAADSRPNPKRDAQDQWTDRMRAVTRDLDERLEGIRAAAAARLDTVEAGTAVVTGPDLVRLAAQLTADRQSLEAGVAELLAAVTTDAQRGPDDVRLRTVLGDLRLKRRLPAGRFAGESMDLAAALRDVTPDAADTSLVAAHRSVAAELAKSRGTLVALVDARSRAAVARALATVAALAEADAVPTTARLGDRRFQAAVERELAASRSVRDLQLARLDAALGTLAAGDAAALADAFRAEAWRRGFPSETRPAWSETALAAAVAFEDLDEMVRPDVVALAAAVDADARAIRTTAVADRIRLGPAAAEAWIRTELEDDAAKDDWTADDPRLRLATAVDATNARRRALDDRAESGLRALLTADQFDRLPPRRDRWLAAGKGRGDAKGKSGDRRAELDARADRLAALEAAVAAGKLTREEAAAKLDAMQAERDRGAGGVSKPR